MIKEQQATPYPIRLTADLKEKLKKSAKANGRSLNAEMTFRINASFDDKKEEALKKLIEKILDERG